MPITLRCRFSCEWPVNIPVASLSFCRGNLSSSLVLLLLCPCIISLACRHVLIFCQRLFACNTEYLRNGKVYRHSFNGMLIGTYTRPTQQCRFEWPWVTWKNIPWQEASRGLSAIAELLSKFVEVCQSFSQTRFSRKNGIFQWTNRQTTDTIAVPLAEHNVVTFG